MSSPKVVMAVAALLLLLVSLSARANTTDSSEREWEWEWEKIQELHRQVLADWKAGHGKNKRSEVETRRVFAEWKAVHGKKYTSAREEERRYAAFKDFLRQIDLHEAAFGANSVFTINGPFSDLTDEESRALTESYLPSHESEDQDTLRRPEVNQSTVTTVSVNKAVLAELSLLEQAPGSSLVDGTVAFRLRIFDGGSSSTSASKPVAILPQLSLAMEANLQPPNRRLLSVMSAGARHLDAAKWFVPGSLKRCSKSVL
ncbi:uncharacterized protein LOC124663615 [Lolium rigidum]|uniref:uncharacterized protein LOC124663615 n=1 Tax=Lolium rigidum TaxID=89674 RepID=UPI001F5CDD74|nr:uncharacterized protein LOC124663615 [Lolium rigidum]